jgi:hypothetical protein
MTSRASSSGWNVGARAVPMAERAQARTDWNRVRNMTEEVIEAGAASHPENPPRDEGFMREGRTMRSESPRWDVIRLHIDVDILDWFPEQTVCLPGRDQRSAARLYGGARRQGMSVGTEWQHPAGGRCMPRQNRLRHCRERCLERALSGSGIQDREPMSRDGVAR